MLATHVLSHGTNENQDEQNNTSNFSKMILYPKTSFKDTNYRYQMFCTLKLTLSMAFDCH